MASYTSDSDWKPRKRSRSCRKVISPNSWEVVRDVGFDFKESEFGKSSKKRTSSSEVLSGDEDHQGKMYTSSDDDATQHSSTDLSRGKKPKCITKNAIMARENRLKKKKYLQDLENELEVLRHENSKLKTSLDGFIKDVKVIRKENFYLRNVLANSKEISQLIRAVNVSTGLPTATSLSNGTVVSSPSEMTDSTPTSSKTATKCATNKFTSSEPCAVPFSAVPNVVSAAAVRRCQKDFPIAFDDVPLSLSAPEDNGELDILCSSNNSPSDLDLYEPSYNDFDDLGFGPNVFGDWLDGDVALSNIGVCLHVAKERVSLEFCASCNENSFRSLNEGIPV